MNKCCIYLLSAVAATLVSCGPSTNNVENNISESSIESEQATVNEEAMSLLSGIWIDEDTNAIVLRVVGDSIVYADKSVMPAHFMVLADTLVVTGVNEIRYHIEQLTDEQLYYQDISGETRHLTKSHNPADSIVFDVQEPQPIELDVSQLDRDTVMFTPSGKRYHLYVKVNPSQNKVYATSYNEEGMAVRTAYYDNIVHIGVFDGATRICSHDFRKADFADFVPEIFYESAILYNIEFGAVDNDATHFTAVLSQPEGYTNYIVSITVSHNGEIKVEAVE